MLFIRRARARAPRLGYWMIYRPGSESTGIVGPSAFAVLRHPRRIRIPADVNCFSEHWRATRSIDEVRTQTLRQTFRAMQHAPPSRKERASLRAEVS